MLGANLLLSGRTAYTCCSSHAWKIMPRLGASRRQAGRPRAVSSEEKVVSNVKRCDAVVLYPRTALCFLFFKLSAQAVCRSVWHSPHFFSFHSAGTLFFLFVLMPSSSRQRDVIYLRLPSWTSVDFFCFHFHFVTPPPLPPIGGWNERLAARVLFLFLRKPLQLISSRVVQTEISEIIASTVPTVQRSW